MMGGSMFGTGFGLYGLFGMLFNIAILVGVIMLAVWAVQRFTGSSSGSGVGGQHTRQPQSAREILDQRYARGELNREEYQEKLHDISG
jgi:putative membrane protein